MKTAILSIFLSATGLTYASEAEHTDIKSRVEQKIMDETNDLISKVEGEKDIVRVSLTVDEDGRLTVLESDFSNESLKNEVVSKLHEIEVNESYNTNEVYYFQFSFEKI
ncbi:MAG: hypothetical protein K9J17_05080 [Flavobacteriales bacterium]|nr:hypothetical protein [Flavobacteriales bacterium]